MFREIVRKKQALSQDECIEILKSEPRGVLSLIGDGGYPYGVPIYVRAKRTSESGFTSGASLVGAAIA